MRMIDLGSQRGRPLHMHINMKLMDAPTSVDCSREVRLRRSFRSLLECVVPPCCGLQPSSDSLSTDAEYSTVSHTTSTSTTATNTIHDVAYSSSRVTGTFFGYRKGRVRFCIQDTSRSSTTSRPLLLLEFGVPTAFLAGEMQHGLLRIALVECGGEGGQYTVHRHKSSDLDRHQQGRHDQDSFSNYTDSCNSNTNSTTSHDRRNCSSSSSLLKVPVWCMYCNGRKVGFAMRREMTVGDMGVLKLMQSVSVGAGVLPVDDGGSTTGHDLLMYLRASFKRVIGSADSQSFHMINPDDDKNNNYFGSSGQELSIFLLRSS